MLETSSCSAAVAGLEPNAIAGQNSKPVFRNSIQGARQEIVNWLAEPGYTKV